MFTKYHEIQKQRNQQYIEEVLKDAISRLIEEGLSTQRIAARLNLLQLRTLRGRAWTAQTVGQMLKRLGLRTIYAEHI